jgi:hypothetical protein
VSSRAETGSYVVGYAYEQLPVIESARDSLFGGHKPADTPVGVDALSRPKSETSGHSEAKAAIARGSKTAVAVVNAPMRTRPLSSRSSASRSAAGQLDPHHNGVRML